MTKRAHIPSAMPRSLPAWMLAGALCVLVAACDFEQPTCVRDEECRDGFLCSTSSGYCEPDWENIGGGDLDVDAAREDAGPDEDAVDTPTESGNDEDTTHTPSLCVGELGDSGCFTRFEPNDTRSTAYNLTASAFGCTGGGGDLRELDTVKTAGLCGGDTVDWYELEYVECRDTSFRIDVLVEPFSDNCPLDTYALNIKIGDQTYHCSPDRETTDFDARCTTLSDGGRQLTVFIDDQFRPETSFASIVVKSTADNGTAFFDYDMRVRLY